MRDDAALKARVQQQLKDERTAAAAAREIERRAQAEAAKTRELQIRTESEATFSQYKGQQIVATAADDAGTIELQLARLRARMPDPASMQVRDAHLNTARTAVCASVSYADKGKDVGPRNAYITLDTIWVEPAPDEVAHRVFELNYKNIGC